KCGYKKDNYELNYKFLNNLQPKWKQYGTLIRQTKNLMDINIDALYNIIKQNQGDVNDALGYKKKAVVITSDPLALVAEKTKKFYSKPTNNNLRTSSTSQSANKKQEFVKSDDKKVEKKDDERKQDMSKVKCYNCKKDGHFAKDCKKAKVKAYNYYKTKMLLAKKDSDEQVLLAEDKAWMESSSDSDQEINANMVFMCNTLKLARSGIVGSGLKSVWESIRPSGHEVDWFCIGWHSSCVPRHAFLLWLVMVQKLKTQDKMRQWDVGDKDDLNLLHCPLSNRRSLNSVVSCLVFAASAYFMWQEQNNRVHSKDIRKEDQLSKIIIEMVRLKIATLHIKRTSIVVKTLAHRRISFDMT
nr:hypothetical protein [Tanacetum cinerariifolium]